MELDKILIEGAANNRVSQKPQSNTPSAYGSIPRAYSW